VRRRRPHLWPNQKRSYKRRLLNGRQWVECHYCGLRITEQSATLDHVVALCHGGDKGIRNIVLACRMCNQRKGQMSYKRFVRTTLREAA